MVESEMHMSDIASLRRAGDVLCVCVCDRVYHCVFVFALINLETFYLCSVFTGTSVDLSFIF